MNKTLLAAAIAAIALALSGCGDRAGAAVSQVSWTTAAQYEDGSPLPASDIAGTLVQWGTCGGPYSAGSQLVPMPATAMPLPALGSGATCFVAFTVLTDTAAAAKPSAKQSKATAEVRLVVPTVPGAPVNFGLR